MIEMFGKDDRSYHLKRVFEWITYQYPNISHLRAAISTVVTGERMMDTGVTCAVRVAQTCVQEVSG